MTWSEENFDPYSGIKSISIPRHKTPLSFDPDAKNQPFSTATQKKTMPIHRTEMKSFSTTHTTTKSISSYTGIESSSISHTEIKSICTAHTKCKSIGMLTLTTSDFRPVFKNQVNFDHPHKINFIRHWNQVRFDPSNWNQVNLDRHHQNQVNVHAHTKNK